jgi:putative acetyltransferase
MRTLMGEGATEVIASLLVDINSSILEFMILRFPDLGGQTKPVTEWEIRKEDLSSEAARDLVRLHLEGMHAHSPPGSVFALDFSGLLAPEVTLWAAWQAAEIAGIGALKDLGGGAGEIKSMRTHPKFLRRGIGVAKVTGMKRLSLETGSGVYFEPALSLYRRRGFVNCNEFADYKRTAFNQFLHLNL